MRGQTESCHPKYLCCLTLPYSEWLAIACLHCNRLLPACRSTVGRVFQFLQEWIRALRGPRWPPLFEGTIDISPILEFEPKAAHSVQPWQRRFHRWLLCLPKPQVCLFGRRIG